mmetsp:Transcript_18472/g.37746  ORF Transcript_18472/g.37746 Transcript_18472/m.37746 type:complete len:374 (+) Transcript_18472:122-1243(+)
MVDGDDESRGDLALVEAATKEVEARRKAWLLAKKKADEARKGMIKGGRLAVAKETEARKRDLIKKKKELEDAVRESERQHHRYNEKEAKAEELRQRDLDGARKYLSHVDLARACEKEAKAVADLRAESEKLKVAVGRAEARRREESRKVASLAKYVDVNPQKVMSGAGGPEGVEISKPLKDLDVTPENETIKSVYDKLRKRRDKALVVIEESRAREKVLSLELETVEESLRVAKERYLDPEADQQLAFAHKEAHRLRTAVATLQLEADLGYQFAAQSSGDVQSINADVEALRAKEARKRAKIKAVSFDRDAARDEYNSWVRADTGHELRNAMKVMENAIKTLEKMDNLKRRAEQQEAQGDVRERLASMYEGGI